nr:hypothetical protein [Tanacetum cinerariifolium]
YGCTHSSRLCKKESWRSIDIRVDIVHPTPADVFPAATVIRTLAQHREAIRGIHGNLEGVPINEEMNALRFKMGMVKEENASLRGKVCYLHAAGAALTWWNGYVRTLGHDAAYAMTWEILKKKLTNKYCPKGEIKKLEIELWNLKVDKYISGLSDNIHGNVMAARPKTLDDAIELANNLMDQKLCTYAERQAENKRKLDNNHQAQQQLLKKQNVAQAYAVGTEEKKSYGGSKPLCPKCNYHHDGECTEARGMVYALGGGETNQDLDNTEDNINA